jgi:hypothetical protein
MMQERDKVTDCICAQSFLDTGIAHYRDLEERVFHTLKGETLLDMSYQAQAGVT